MSIFGIEKYAKRTDLLDGYAARAQRKPNAAAPTEPQDPAKKGGLDTAYAAWKARPTPETMGNILTEARPVISSGMTTYARGDNPVLRGKAKRLTLDAIRSYDPAKAASLRSWITLNLRGLQRFAGETSPITAPERMRLDAFRVAQAKNEFEAATGRQPGDDELADLVGLSPARISKVVKTVRPIFNEGMFTANDDGGDEGSVHEPAVVHTDWQDIWMNYVYSDLDPVNKQIFDMRLGRGQYEGKTMSVGDMARSLGISTAAVSQRSKRIADKMAEGYQYEGRF